MRNLTQQEFDISEYNPDGSDFWKVSDTGDVLVKPCFMAKGVAISRDDSIAYAKHFKLKAEDLK